MIPTAFLFFFFFFIKVAEFQQEQYQQVTHLSGEKGNFEDDIAEIIYGSTNQYAEENSIGGLICADSFLNVNTSELIVMFGIRKITDTYTDQVWMYSVDKHQWKFVKGNKDLNVHYPKYNINDHSFDETYQIGQRFNSGGWINGDIISIFGGKEIFGHPSGYQIVNSLDLWRFNLTNYQYAMIKRTSFNFNTYWYDCYGNPPIYPKQYEELAWPGGRSNFQMVKIDEDEVFMFGGEGYDTFESSYVDYLGEIWFFSNTLMKWKIMGQSNLLNCTYKYENINQIGKRKAFQASLINSEEILIFGGDTSGVYYDNSAFKYNITSNQWKAASKIGYFSSQSGFFREYLPFEINRPGGRIGHKMWKINDHEVITFAGRGHGYGGSEVGYLLDLFSYDFERNLWKFIGKEVSKFQNSYSEEIMGAQAFFVGNFIESKNSVIYCLGENLRSSGTKLMYGDDCFELYMGNKCFSIKGENENVCNSHGKCTGYNTCECNEGYFGSQCELTKCNEILSNESTVCSKNGICLNHRCTCFDSQLYINSIDCSTNEEIKQIMDNLWIYISVPIGIVIAIILVLFFFVFAIILCIKLRKVLKKFEGIEDVDLILHEAKLEQNSTNPKIKIDKSLFEIEFSDLSLISVIGEGGSSSICYLAKWRNIYCAYKGFRISPEMLTDQKIFGEFEREVQIYSSIHHPSILQFYGACVSPPKVGIVLEFAQNGDLSNFLNTYTRKTGKSYNFANKLRILKEIALGMEYLHGMKIIHRDLKPENILIDDNENSKIMDFGLSKFKEKNSEKTMTQKIGTSYYMAPEVFKGKQYSFKCDVFSWAILAAVVITENFFPYGIDTNQGLILKKVSEDTSFRPRIKKRDFPYESKLLFKLIQKNWKSCPNERDSFKEIIKSLEIEEKNFKKRKDDQRKKMKQETDDEIKEIQKNFEKVKNLLKSQKTFEEKLENEKKKNKELLLKLNSKMK